MPCKGDIVFELLALNNFNPDINSVINTISMEPNEAFLIYFLIFWVINYYAKYNSFELKISNFFVNANNRFELKISFYYSAAFTKNLNGKYNGKIIKAAF
ncbi:hypothetical protein BpHYR1_021843 [Brachionus plicatilis]|uniref:Uncharacterized protein n=1 Tax=Brachionus plicatilis TaxID=10195 RepID=A0A3M7T3Z0_BRAPC|nr:hypothetical protein BpHYR1_021843 [Brachionus plicatilis]